jgi:hypothetical protein
VLIFSEQANFYKPLHPSSMCRFTFPHAGGNFDPTQMLPHVLCRHRDGCVFTNYVAGMVILGLFAFSLCKILILHIPLKNAVERIYNRAVFHSEMYQNYIPLQYNKLYFHCFTMFWYIQPELFNNTFIFTLTKINLSHIYTWLHLTTKLQIHFQTSPKYSDLVTCYISFLFI